MQRHSQVVGLCLALSAAGFAGHARGQQPGPALPPLPHRVLQQLHGDASLWQEFRARHATVHVGREVTPAATPAAAPPATGRWTTAARPEGDVPLSNPLLLTDGTVIAHQSCTSDWYRLTPNSAGSYVSGSWSKIASMPSGYAPRFFASAVLSDGRVIVEGGEYNGAECLDVETSLGAIYDPVKNTWTKVKPPPGWAHIGDGSAIVLPDGRFVLSNAYTNELAVLDPASLTWVSKTPAGKTDSNNEENWTLLPNGGVLTVEAYTTTQCSDGAALFVPGTAPALGSWTNAGTTIHKLSGCSGSILGFEAPTQILRPNGTVAAFGSTASMASQNLPVYTAIYSTTKKTWTAGPSMPKVDGKYYTMADAPAAILPTGDALLATGPGIWPAKSSEWYPEPTHFFTFNGRAFTQVGDVENAPDLSSYEMNFLVLPTGGILATETDFTGVNIYGNACCAASTWAPAITSLSSTTLTRGSTYSVSGKQLSGLGQGASYGDDEQADTNFPLVRIVNTKTKHVFYARTWDFTTRSIAPGTASSAKFVVSSRTESGASTLVVVANGIASVPKNVTIR